MAHPHHTDTETEARVRAVLTAPMDVSLHAIGRSVGRSHSSVSDIRYGRAFPNVLPELARLEPGQLSRTCLDCLHFSHHEHRSAETRGKRLGACDLRYPESSEITFARGCGAFWPCSQSGAGHG